MKIKLLLILFWCLIYPYKSVSQTDEANNQKGKWFFGIETGLNTITSLKPNNENSLHGGVLAEYYFSKYFSLSGRIKYFKTGVSNYHDSSRGFFLGEVISMPLDVNFETKLINNIKFNLKLGIALNQEIKSNYYYPPSEKTSYSTFYGSFNPGIGISYYISKNTAFFINYETFILGNDRQENTGFDFQLIPNSPNNNLLNIGIKHNFFQNKE